MKIFRIDNEKFNVLIHRPTSHYVAVEKDSDRVLAKLLVIYGKKFDAISDEYVIQVHFLGYHKETNSYYMTRDGKQAIKMNELKDVPVTIKISLRIQELLGF